MTKSKCQIENERIWAETVNVLNEFTKKYRGNKWNYLVESDIQCELFSDLRAKINLSLSPKIEPMGGVSAPQLTVNCVNSEFNPRRDMMARHDRIDLVCLDAECAPLIKWNGKPNHTDWIYSLRALVGIELKHFWIGSKNGIQGLRDDLEKLKKMEVPNGLSLAYFHDSAEFEKHAKYGATILQKLPSTEIGLSNTGSDGFKVGHFRRRSGDRCHSPFVGV